MRSQQIILSSYLAQPWLRSDITERHELQRHFFFDRKKCRWSSIFSSMPVVLGHLSGNWNRVNLDVYSKFIAACPTSPLIQHSVPDLPVYSVDPEPSHACLVSMAAKLRHGHGVTDVMIACNTSHGNRERFEAESGVRMVDMISPTIAACENQYGVVGLLCTTRTLEQAIYRSDICKFIIPSPAEQQVVQAAIEDCKVLTSVSPQSQLVPIIAALKQRGAEAIILGCTDLPSLLPLDLGLPTLNPIDFLVAEAKARLENKSTQVVSLCSDCRLS